MPKEVIENLGLQLMNNVIAAIPHAFEQGEAIQAIYVYYKQTHNRLPTIEEVEKLLLL